MSLLLAELAAGLGGAGQIVEGLGVVDKALRARSRPKRDGTSRSYSVRRDCFSWSKDRPQSRRPSQCFDQTLDVARRQGALWWELRAAMSLARLWRGQGRGSHARKLLAAVYRRFPERFGTVDLITAKALLASLR